MMLVVRGACLSMFAGSLCPAQDWPRFRGPNGDNISTETGLLKQWPEGGPPLLWTTSGIGFGYSTVAIAHGLIYTAGNIGDKTVITALDMAGKIQWQVKNGPAWKKSYPGTRSTPTIDGGRLYYESPLGAMVCLEAKTGRRLWGLNTLEKFGGRNITWALAESLLIDGNRVICTPGGKDAGIVALDRNSGETVWICRGFDDKPGYCTPIVLEYKGLRQIVTMMARSVVGVNAETGKLLWRFEHVTPYDENINSPIFHDGCIFISTQVTGSRLLRLSVQGNDASVTQEWHTKALDSQHGGVLLLNGYLYGASRRASPGPWVCLEFKTAKRMYGERGIGKGSLTYADGMLYMLNEKGTVGLVKATPDAHEVVSQFRIPKGGSGPSWAHPVVCGGRLYIRHADYLYAYDIK